MANPRVVEKPLESRRAAMTQSFSKTAADKSRGLNLDIDVWLRGIGLEQYAQTFRDNAIDADVCSPRFRALDGGGIA
jgi:hypothetical protein